ncbi:MAG: hypothetical protein PHQ46_12900 [Negativicutes bacterium]|nr:hypothetical protein [Negativicutes bacterium]
MMNKREAYLSALKRLPIDNPTPEDMAMLCPHLTVEEAVEAFTIGSGEVACPPLKVRHSFQVIALRKERVDNFTGSESYGKVIPKYLSLPFVRTDKSYADGRGQSIDKPYKHMGKAMAFAEANWGNELVLDDWKSIVEFYVKDPTDLINGRPRITAVFRVALSRDFNEIVAEDYSKPRSELLDDAISQIALNPFVSQEIRGRRGGFEEHNCAHCGAGLLVSSCVSCGHKFRDNGCRSGWYTPLSRKMVAFLRENGHKFAVDPEIAWAKERKSWEEDCLKHEEFLKRRKKLLKIGRN